MGLKGSARPPFETGGHFWAHMSRVRRRGANEKNYRILKTPSTLTSLIFFNDKLVTQQKKGFIEPHNL